MEALIGVVCGHRYEPEETYLRRGYLKGILQAGGVPLLLPVLPKKALIPLLDRVQGLLLVGGPDIDPFFYGMEPEGECGQIHPLWDELELFVIQNVSERNLPILGICRGIQVLNVAFGGDLIQDIKAKVGGSVEHEQKAPKQHPTHQVVLKEGSILQRIFALDSLRVNTFHHQAVGRVAQDFTPVAHARDGVIEAIEKKGHPFVVGVQWHPELMLDDYPEQHVLFRQLVHYAKQS